LIYIYADFKQANDRYLELLQVVFDVAGKLSTVTQGSGESPISSTAREFYEGALRLTVVIFHDFQDFLVQNHFRLCNNIPDGSVQLKNLVLSAVPSESPEYPYPFQPGMKPEAVDGMLDPPVIRNDFELLLKDSKLTPSLKNLLESNEPSPTSVNKLYQSIRSSEPPSKKRISIESHQQALIHAVVLYIFVHAVQTGTGEIYNKAGPHASVLRLLSQVLNLEDRVHFVDAIVNQLRFPNAHTLFSLHAVLDLFSDMPPASLNNNGDDSNDPDTVMELIVRMLLDRLAVNRPHPWGVIVALSELYKSSEYAFWDLPFIKNTPEVRQLLLSTQMIGD
jgi:CCR4-NOT transcription complex subunit 1